MSSINTLTEGALLQGGRYRIEKTLGAGGFGVTYLASQPALKREVAVKEFYMKEYCEREESSSHVSVPATNSRIIVDKFKQKFIREAQMIASLDHQSIVKVFDIFEENGTAYYAMEFLPGGSLTDKVKSGGALPEQIAEGYIRQLASALEYLHGKNILHFDIKPSNVLFSETGRAKLIDFGISKHYDEAGGQTSSTPVGISEGYAPLEQYSAGDISTFTPATDIYSLGATLYYMVVGHAPQKASEVNESGLERPEGISDRIWNAIESAMQPRRKDRPQSAEAFLALLDGKVAASGILPTGDESTRIEVKQTVRRQNVKRRSSPSGEETLIASASQQRPKQVAKTTDGVKSNSSIGKKQGNKPKRYGETIATVLIAMVFIYILYRSIFTR